MRTGSAHGGEHPRRGRQGLHQLPRHPELGGSGAPRSARPVHPRHRAALPGCPRPAPARVELRSAVHQLGAELRLAELPGRASTTTPSPRPEIESLVQALACDVTRTAALNFWAAGDPGFVTEFAPATSPYIAGNWHASIHGDGSPNNPSSASLTKGFGFYAKYFTKLIQRLAAVQDVDGRRLLDNTLVLWVSDLGYGSGHYCYNYPVVLAGLKGAFPKGQGRHVVGQVNSLGDLYAQVLRMLGGTDTTFGSTARSPARWGLEAASTSCRRWAAPGLITKDTPLHFGALDL